MINTGCGTRMTPEDIQKMRELHEQGLGSTAIAKIIGTSDKTVISYVGRLNKGKGRRINNEDIIRMNALRDQGLSNSQIAIEMGITKQTVYQHLGNQPKGVRAEYGSIVAHADGDSFAKHEVCKWQLSTPHVVGDISETLEPKKDEPAKLSVARSVTTYDGSFLRYKVDTNGQIIISVPNQPESICLDFKQFNKMLEELMELSDKIPASKR